MGLSVRHFWLLDGPKLRERLEAWPRVRLPTPVVEVVENNKFARYLVCYSQTGKVKGKFNYSHPKRQTLFKRHVDAVVEVDPRQSQAEPETGVG
eukprot:3218772-Amphidinium_carterae.1